MEKPRHVTLSSDGRMVIPAALRRQLGLEPGMTLEVAERDGRLVVVPADRSELERRIWDDEAEHELPVWLRSA